MALRTALPILGTEALVALSTVWFRRTLWRDDALAERGSDQGVRAVWPGPASIR